VPVADLIDEMRGEWTAATRHPFLQAVGTGTADAFGLWMAQDAVFVADLIAFQARLVARAPRSAQRVLADGVVGLLAELDWFDEAAAALGVQLGGPPLPATLQYRELLDRLDRSTYAEAIVALWALERVYLEAWRYAGACTSDPRFGLAVSHWTDPEFARYVQRLEDAADEALDRDRGGLAREAMRRVLDAEVAFWDMADAEHG
jgi:thiaminase/transcriptional activator TenA